MQMLIDDTLDLWREAQRTLERLPATSPDHETVALLVVEVRETYQRLTQRTEASSEVLRTTRESIDAARLVLREIRDRRKRGGGQGLAAPT